MQEYSYVLFFSLVGGLFSLIGGVLLLLNKTSTKTLKKYAPPFAAGALLSTAFLDLLKEGIHESSADTVLLAALIGIVAFYLLERFLHWFHHSSDYSHKHGDHKTGLIIIGDTVHNALDGLAIAASFLVSVPSGIVTSIVVSLHEIPHEISDFGLLLSRGMSRKRVLIVNIASALITTLVAVIVYAIGSTSGIDIGFISGLSAGFLLYIALSDIIPSIHNGENSKQTGIQSTLLLLAGIVLVAATITIAHGYMEPDEEEHSSYIQGILT